MPEVEPLEQLEWEALEEAAGRLLIHSLQAVMVFGWTPTELKDVVDEVAKLNQVGEDQ